MTANDQSPHKSKEINPTKVTSGMNDFALCHSGSGLDWKVTTTEMLGCTQGMRVLEES